MLQVFLSVCLAWLLTVSVVCQADTCPTPPGGTQGFLAVMRPIIQAENHRIAVLRSHLQAWQHQIDRDQPLTVDENMALAKLAGTYRVTFGPNTEAVLQALLVRVDEIPMGLALAQAANESAWGKSRFARQACNYYGQWCYTPGCGLVPQARTAGATHEVRAFAKASESVAAYMLNLNRNSAYADFRAQRQQLRRAGQPLTAKRLVAALAPYTRQNPDYTAILARMIAQYQMDKRG